MKLALGLSVRLLMVLLLLPIFFERPAQAQNVQQERRIEEGKRDALKPTALVPTAPPAQPSRPRRLAAPVPPAEQDVYLFQLAQRRIAFRYDAIKAIVILLNVDDQYLDLASQVAFLQERRILPKRYRESFDPMEPLRRGLTAYMFRQVLGIRGGIALHLLGPSERYAMKELVFQGILSSGRVNDLISGAELVQVMNQAAQYQLAHRAGGAE